MYRMNDTDELKISEMEEAEQVNNEDLIMIVQNGINKKVQASKLNLRDLIVGRILELVFPIGSTYITQTNVNPNTILGFGTWERLKGKVCLGLDEDDTDFDAIGKTGGEKEHTLTIPELAEHDHIANSLIYWAQTASSGLAGTDGTYWRAEVRNTGKSGGNQPHNNMQPFEIVGYMWIRRT